MVVGGGGGRSGWCTFISRAMKKGKLWQQNRRGEITPGTWRGPGAGLGGEAFFGGWEAVIP